jgi:MFS transporter, putative metabolite:H+ symporter
MEKKQHSILNIAVIVAALGYFVDIYDLLLFTIVREPSLHGLGVTDAGMIAASTKIINWQMLGLLIGGVIWGIMGDKKGRLSVLFGSIMLYSVANFITGYITTVDQYAAARFAAGIGLAGELGAGITLVSELLPKNKRGIGTSLVWGSICIFRLPGYGRLAPVLQDRRRPGHCTAASAYQRGRERYVSYSKIIRCKPG